MSGCPAQNAGMNAQRWFQRKQDYAPRQTPADSPFRKFDMKCLACGSCQLRLGAQMDEEAREKVETLKVESRNRMSAARSRIGRFPNCQLPSAIWYATVVRNG